MLLINGKSIIERQIGNLPSNSINKIIIIVGYKSKKLIDHIKSLKIKHEIIFIKNNNYNKTNCAYSLILANNFFNRDSIIINCDLLFSKNTMNKLCKFKTENNKVCVRKNHIFKTDLQDIYEENEKIINWSLNLEKSNGEVMGPVFMTKSSLFKLVKYFNSLNLNNQYKLHCFSLLSSSLKFISYQTLFISDDEWIEIDTVNDFNEAKKLTKNKLFTT